MMAVGSRLVSLLTLSTLAILFCPFNATPVAALSIESHGARSFHHPAHEAIAKRKRGSTGKRCKPRSIPSALPVPSADKPAQTSPSPPESTSSNGGNNNNGTNAGNSGKDAGNNSTESSSGNSGNNQGNGGGWSPNSKSGLGWPNGPGDLEHWKGISTIYTWSPGCPDNAASFGITCCPMLWGWNQVDQWKSQVMGASPSCVMGMNEPEISGQSNMDVGSGVKLWNDYVRPMKAKGAKLISPATTSDPAGKKWMQDFYSTCGGDNKCDVDYHACHWYDTTGDKLIAYLTDLHDTFGLPMWLTEFACQNFNNGPQCTQDQVRAFQGQVTAFLQQTSWILVYMPFGAMHDMQGVNPDNQLMSSDGSPNALAKAYFNL